MSFKILFMGTPNFAVPILKALFESKHKILETYTQPPKKKDRGQKTHKSATHDFCDKFNIPVRCPISLESKNELDLKTAQKIFGYFDKSQLIDMFILILEGEEKKVMDIYRKIYDQGVDPKSFINDFLELLYYFKNINSLTLESTNFSLNDEEFNKIKETSNRVDNQIF